MNCEKMQVIINMYIFINQLSDYVSDDNLSVCNSSDYISCYLCNIYDVAVVHDYYLYIYLIKYVPDDFDIYLIRMMIIYLIKCIRPEIN